MRRFVWWGAAALAVVAIAVGVLGAVFGWQWGDVPTWVQSVATVAALGAAGVGAYFAYRQLSALRGQVKLQADALKLQMEEMAADRTESEKRARQETDFRRAELRRQAEQIEVAPYLEAVVLGGVVYKDLLALHITNGSSRPIRNVACQLDIKPYLVFPHSAERRSTRDYSAIKMSRRPIAYAPIALRDALIVFAFPIQVCEPDQELPSGVTHLLWRREEGYSIAGNPLSECIQLCSPVRVYMARFTDDAGLHWELTNEMHLTQISDRNDW